MELNRLQKLAGILSESAGTLKPAQVIKLNKHIEDLKKLAEALPTDVSDAWNFKQVDKLVDELLAVQGKVTDALEITGT